jgi:hypothetical protein
VNKYRKGCRQDLKIDRTYRKKDRRTGQKQIARQTARVTRYGVKTGCKAERN